MCIEFYERTVQLKNMYIVLAFSRKGTSKRKYFFCALYFRCNAQNVLRCFH